MATQITREFISSNTHTVSLSKKSIWAGRIISAIPVLFLLFDSIIKFTDIPPVVEAFNRLGIPVSLAKGIGTLCLVCLVLYLVPRTSVLGAVLFTGYLGGAAAMHVRVGDPLFSHVLFPIYVGTLLWLGLYLRDDRLRELIGRR